MHIQKIWSTDPRANVNKLYIVPQAVPQSSADTGSPCLESRASIWTTTFFRHWQRCHSCKDLVTSKPRFSTRLMAEELDLPCKVGLMAHFNRAFSDAEGLQYVNATWVAGKQQAMPSSFLWTDFRWWLCHKMNCAECWIQNFWRFSNEKYRSS